MTTTAADSFSCIRFDDLRLEPGQRLIFRGERRVKLGKLSFDFLEVLAQSSPNLVTHEELSEKVWSGRPVTPETISQRVAMLRQALGDDAINPRYIEVVRGEGFRLIPPLHGVDDSAPDGRRHLRVMSVERLVIAGLIAVIAILIYRDFDGSVRSGVAEARPTEVLALADAGMPRIPNSLAVLPFASLSPDPADEYFAAGIHVELINRLHAIDRGLTVIGRRSVLAYRDEQVPVTQIAAELNVGRILDGVVSYADDKVAVFVELTDGWSGELIWSGRYEAQNSDIASLQADIAVDVAQELPTQLTTEQLEGFSRLTTQFPEAFRNYLKAISVDGEHADLELLERAIEIDPNFALAHAVKAWTISNQLRLGLERTFSREEAARVAAMTAVELDPQLAKAHLALAGIHALRWQSDSAAQSFARAYQLSPNDPDFLGTYGIFKRITGDYAEGIRLGTMATRLDPHSAFLWHRLGVTYAHAGDLVAADNALQNALIVAPLFRPAHLELGFSHVAAGRLAEAEELFRRAETIGTESLPAMISAQLALAWDRLGSPEDAARFLQQIEASVETGNRAEVSLAIGLIANGQYDAAFEQLRAALESETPLEMNAAIEFKLNRIGHPVLNEPRFVELRNQIRFTDR